MFIGQCQPQCKLRIVLVHTLFKFSAMKVVLVQDSFEQVRYKDYNRVIYLWCTKALIVCPEMFVEEFSEVNVSTVSVHQNECVGHIIR